MTLSEMILHEISASFDYYFAECNSRKTYAPQLQQSHKPKTINTNAWHWIVSLNLAEVCSQFRGRSHVATIHQLEGT